MRIAIAAALCALATADPAAALTVLPGFHSPSGNIRCFLVHGTLRCQLARADYSTMLQARCAGLDWHGFELNATRKAGVTCSGGILYSPSKERPGYVNLPYGRSWRQGVFTCTSRLTGVTCRNRTGHGLFVSRQTWRVW
jgi:hypothetical protein